ncbi:MAG: HD domain-containing protein [Negativicutes bacterium]|nr:HD domain-containing protein [Negativicutes bacterium]
MRLSVGEIKKMQQGQAVSGLYAVSRFEARTTEKAGRFGIFTVSDVTGSMAARLWNIAPSQEEALKSRSFLKLKGITGCYNNEVQLTVNELIIPSAEEIGGCLRELAPHVDGDLAAMYREILAAAAAIRHPGLRGTVEALIKEDLIVSRKFQYHPGALSYHHAAIGGLLKHTHEVLSYAMDFCRRDGGLNQDMMTALAILHDIGKVEEIEVDGYGLPVGFTKSGKLLGHICLGLKMVAAAGRSVGLDQETALVLEHGIYSHHGAPEWGSPVLPKTKEAQLIHYLDNISAKNDQFDLAVRQVEPGSFSAYDRGLQREIYKPGNGE